jgi:MFS family permease
MITLCHVASGVLLIGTGLLFNAGALSAATLTACWVVVFFFASAGASAAYLTGSEIFPLETRAMALAFFYAVGTGVGGVTGPLLFGKLVGTERRSTSSTATCWAPC